MPKRKKSPLEDGMDSKRKKYDLSEQLQELMDSLRNYKTSQGKLLCETFIRAPKRRSLAEYYEVVSNPIDLLRIQQKIRMDEYDDLDQFTADIELLVNNTKSYFRPDSVEHSDALKLWDVYLDLKNQFFGTSGSASTSDESSIGGYKNDSADETIHSSNVDSESIFESDYEELFGTVMSACDDGRQLSTMFELLPSKSLYRDYYDIVTDPIDLKTIGSKIQNHEYSSLNDLEKDLLLMIKNAKIYNAPGSQIYKDANALKRVIQQKKIEIETRRLTPAQKSSERIRAKRQIPFQAKWSSIAASLKYEDEGVTCASNSSAISFTDDLDENTNDETLNFSDSELDQSEPSNPQWLLYNAVNDTPHSEPFIRLPSRRFYPDYYKEIKHPISLAQIKSRIKVNFYENITDLVQDLTLVFENAMNYNRPDSKIYKDAAKLKKILQVKARAIISAFKDDAEDGDDNGMDDDVYDEDCVRSSTKLGQTATNRSKRSMVNAMSLELKNVRRSQKANNSELKNRMLAIYHHLLNFNERGRYLIDPFMEKPSRKVYPDYYDVIECPIDMKTIETKIKNDNYESENSLISDFRLMFANCRKYNEDHSLIYDDANKLEQELNLKLRDIGPSIDETRKAKKERNSPSSATKMKIKTLFETVRDYVCPKGRLLSAIFQKLPSKTEFPDYYEIIPKPICLEKISSRIKNNIYETVEDLLSDIILMLDNACRYNEPDSQIFKDALTLQQLALKTKIELNEDSVNGIPDVKIIVQDLLTNLFISVYNYQDEEGRCFSDSINELSEINATDKSFETELKTINFDIIKRNLNLGRYRRMDRFQQDMFEVFERARKMSRTDSQAFEDSIELQNYFIKLRDDLCRNGQLLSSSALNYNIQTLNAHIEGLRKEKASKELSEDESIKNNDEKEMEFNSSTANFSSLSSDFNLKDNEIIAHQDLKLRIGDFVYVEPHDKSLEPHIVYIENFHKDTSGQILVRGCWFYRPNETYHLASRKFLEKEVFKSDNYTATPINQVIGKCCVMFVKDYFRCEPVGIPGKDVYVCESRYTSKGKSFKKIKIWPCLQNDNYIMRSTSLPINRIPSVFAKNHTSIDFIKADEFCESETEIFGLNNPNMPDVSVLDIARPNIMCLPPKDAKQLENVQYYEQFTIPAGTFKVGDCCYVRTDQERNLICRIDQMWVDSEGNPYFHGPWYVQQAELPSNTVGSFYPQEVFLSSIEDTNPLLSICERCCVLNLKDYCTKRPTEFLEKDVYVCEIKYLEHEKKFELLSNNDSNENFFQNTTVAVDEIYFFRKPLVLTKSSYQLPQVIEEPVLFSKIPEDQMPRMNHETMSIRLDQEESTGEIINGIVGSVITPSSINQPIAPSLPSLPIASQESNPVVNTVVMANSAILNVGNIPNVATPSSIPSTINNFKKKTSKRLVTGYIIFASEVRRSVVEANPECSFGDISRIIGNQWKVLTPDQKNEYEQRAAKQNQEVKEQAAAEKALQESLGPCSPAIAGQSMENGVFECHWANKCDYQFEDAQDLFDHLTAEPNGHVWISYADVKDKEHGEFQCMFHGCGRVKKGAAPFPNIQRLIRHCKEVHINKHIPKYVDPEKRSRNYIPSSKINLQTIQTNTAQSIHPNLNSIVQTSQQQFQTISLPHKPQVALQAPVSSVNLPMIASQVHPNNVALSNSQSQIVSAGNSFISHQIIQPGQTLPGIVPQQTVVSSIPSSTIQIQTPQIPLQSSKTSKILFRYRSSSGAN
ncbi:polybromo-1-like protein [Sarcoptes scabiei]|uniref:Polybromo-1-like protein n=1 Tax=Sarcoptes scabiei TaxID=52283 RepID=A0A132A553_SARSC|nr:polybromo-1-like protein [Sarcoptes scabiei]